jgi:hypothetical protein
LPTQQVSDGEQALPFGHHCHTSHPTMLQHWSRHESAESA